jgi:hypothetical protein
MPLTRRLWQTQWHRTLGNARDLRLCGIRRLSSPTLQNLCGVAAPRSVGSTPAPLRRAKFGFRTGVAMGQVNTAAQHRPPLCAVRSRPARWRMWQGTCRDLSPHSIRKCSVVSFTRRPDGVGLGLCTPRPCPSGGSANAPGGYGCHPGRPVRRERLWWAPPWVDLDHSPQGRSQSGSSRGWIPGRSCGGWSQRGTGQRPLPPASSHSSTTTRTRQRVPLECSTPVVVLIWRSGLPHLLRAP